MSGEPFIELLDDPATWPARPKTAAAAEFLVAGAMEAVLIQQYLRRLHGHLDSRYR